ncbi:hypothetical protein JCM11641_007616 [Rhodosporidiobolus odoratus]
MPPRIRSPTPESEEDQLDSESDSGVPTQPPLPSTPRYTAPAPQFAPPAAAGLPALPSLPPLPPAVQAGQATGRERGGRNSLPTSEDAMDVDKQDEEEYDNDQEEDELEEDDDYAPATSTTAASRQTSRTSARRATGPKPPPRAKSGAAASAGRRKSNDTSAAYAQAAPASVASLPRAGPAAAGGALSGLKIKFKMGGTAAPPTAEGDGEASPASSPAPSVGGRGGGGRKNPPAPPPVAKKSGGKKGKGKKKAESDESDVSLELSDDDGQIPASSRYSSPGMRDEDGMDQDEDELGSEAGSGPDGFDDDASSGSGGSGSDVYGGRKTARQRAKELGGDEALDLMSLPNRVHRVPPPVKTESEIALEKAEKSRKRKSQADKKLEDEKTETINRLLKKPVGRVSSSGSKTGGGNKRVRSKLNKSITADGSDAETEAAAARAQAQEEERVRRANIKPTVARWISSIRPPQGSTTSTATTLEPVFALSYSVPEGLFEVPQQAEQSPVKKVREAPKSRRFSPEEREQIRRMNEDGWRKVMLGAV